LYSSGEQRALHSFPTRRSSDLAENIGAMILGVALFPVFGIAGITFPLVARGFGVLASIVGVYVVRAREAESPMAALNRGYHVTTDRKSTRLNSSHVAISYAVFC